MTGWPARPRGARKIKTALQSLCAMFFLGTHAQIVEMTCGFIFVPHNVNERERLLRHLPWYLNNRSKASSRYQSVKNHASMRNADPTARILARFLG
jgi:hypothetical protein